MHFIDNESTRNYARRYAGGKGLNLYHLAKNGLRVPEFFVIGANFFAKFTTEAQIQEKIEIIFSENKDLNKVSELVEKLILDTPFSEGFEKRIEDEISKIEYKYLSVRSSALDEDGGGHSFAGQLSSFLYQKDLSSILKSIKLCWASGYSHRSLVYREQNKLEMKEISVAVVIQKMIRPDVSGVAFTCDPINESSTEFLINSVYGTGEGLVSGAIEPDQYKIKSEEYELIEEILSKKEKKFDLDEENQDCKEVAVEESLQEKSSLTSNELENLHKVIRQIDRLYGFPQDIEWAIESGVLYLLQSRPVTTKVNLSSGHLFVWDNSNIVESYGGVTLPLTYHFAHYNYHHVYVQFCEVLMVPQKNIRAMDYFLKNMLGTFYGRVYYNLLNWYKLTSILPGYKFNRSFMETMMGTSDSLQDEIAERVKPPSFHKGALAKVRQFFVGAKFLYYHFNIQHVVDSFLSYFYKHYEEFKKSDYGLMTPDEIFLEYQKLERVMLSKWHAPIINDFICMVHYGIFKKLTDKWFGEDEKNIHNDLLAGNGNLESALPTKELIRLAGYVLENKELYDLLIETSDEDLEEVVTRCEFKEFSQMVKTYLDKYGFRCMSEMKIEQKDFHLNPAQFFTFLKNIIRSGQTDLEEYEKREKELRANAEKKAFSHLSGIKEIVYKWSLRNARKAVMNRENTRFCRTRVYGLVRHMFYAIGDKFVERGIIDAPKDVFYLTLDEFKGCFEGFTVIHDIKKLIATRKEEYNLYEQMDEPLPRFATRGPVYWNNQFFEKVAPVEHTDLNENELGGIGCCPGIVEGTIKVISGPEDDLSLNGEILVTHRTDPGWIPLYPSISGLLVERGGLLSHSAIVAREMGLPTIVSIQNLTKKLESGMKVRMDGERGIIEIL